MCNCAHLPLYRSVASLLNDPEFYNKRPLRPHISGINPLTGLLIGGHNETLKCVELARWSYIGRYLATGRIGCQEMERCVLGLKKC